MATVPLCSLCRIPEKVYNKINFGKKTFLVYCIFIIQALEITSLGFNLYSPIKPLCKYDAYTGFYYPIFTQIVLFLLISSLFLWRERLHFCARKTAATFYLAIYYLFNIIALVTCLNAYSYIIYVSLGFVVISFLLMFNSLFNAKNG